MKKLSVPQVFNQVAKTDSRKEKLEILRKNNSLELRDILKGAFDDNIQFILPSGVPPIDEDEKKKYDTFSLAAETKKFRYFVKGGPGEQVNPMRREKMFIDLLYRVGKEEAEIVCHMKDKTLDGVYKGLTKKLVSEAFPGLITK